MVLRMTRNKIEEIILPLIGEDGLPLIKLLYAQPNISEFDLAKKSKKDIKIVRKMLYLMYNHNLVGFTRKKDKEKGWYIYYWTLLGDNVKFMYYKHKKELLIKLKEKLLEEQKELFYVCPKRCVRLNFDQGMDFEFHCPECGELIHQDSENNVVGIKKQIVGIEEDLETEKKVLRKIKIKSRKKAVKAKIKIKRKLKKKKK